MGVDIGCANVRSDKEINGPSYFGDGKVWYKRRIYNSKNDPEFKKRFAKDRGDARYLIR